ncbi:hypothetical protein NEUTE2DRAFT_134892 [Neurospora tetrasperma FGSC 2509]|nr:hypothetical protein NEUTE2DRAFT_134892 [Neurospora tetrasperma FGSC 2509]
MAVKQSPLANVIGSRLCVNPQLSSTESRPARKCCPPRYGNNVEGFSKAYPSCPASTGHPRQQRIHQRGYVRTQYFVLHGMAAGSNRLPVTLRVSNVSTTDDDHPHPLAMFYPLHQLPKPLGPVTDSTPARPILSRREHSGVWTPTTPKPLSGRTASIGHQTVRPTCPQAPGSAMPARPGHVFCLVPIPAREGAWIAEFDKIPRVWGLFHGSPR